MVRGYVLLKVSIEISCFVTKEITTTTAQMSFHINWDLLKSGMEAEQLKQHLNGRFTAIERPSFLGPIEIKSFNFGTVPPEITVENITDPLEDFYIDLLEDHNSQCTPSPVGDSSIIDGGSGFYNSNSGCNMTESHQYQKSPSDFQVEISCKYQGDCSMSISTELIINQPTPSFMSLPLILTLTKSSFQGREALALLVSHLTL
jgi:distribution and morphology protein 12